MRRKNYYFLSMLLLLVVFLAVIWWPDDQNSFKENPKLETVATKSLFELPDQETRDYKKIISQPLFTSARLPPTAKRTLLLETTTKTDLLLLKIKGIVANGIKKMVLLERNNKLIELYEGSQLDGWTLKKIGPNSIILSKGKAKINLLRTRDDKTPTISRNTKWLPKDRSPK